MIGPKGHHYQTHHLPLLLGVDKREFPLVDFAYEYTNTISGEQIKLQRKDFVLIADFDDEAVLEVTNTKTWSQFANYLGPIFPHAIINCSVSNKVKVFFLIEGTGTEMNRAKRIKALRALLPEELFKYVDTSDTAMTVSFFKKPMVEIWLHQCKDRDLQPTKLETLLPASMLKREKELDKQVITKETEEELRPVWNRFTGILEDYEGAEALVVQHIISTIHITEGAILPQKAIAELTGVSQSTVSNTINKLVKQGKLEVVSHSYIPGKRAKEYRLVCPKLVQLHLDFVSKIEDFACGHLDVEGLNRKFPLLSGQTFINTPVWVKHLAWDGNSMEQILKIMVENNHSRTMPYEYKQRVRSLLKAA